MSAEMVLDCADLVGTAVAGQVDEARQVAGDGFLIALPNVSRNGMTEADRRAGPGVAALRSAVARP